MSKKVSFKFEELEYQNDAVNAVIDLLDGIDRYAVSSIYSNPVGHLATTRPESNVRFNVGKRLVDNLNKIQYRNGIFKDRGIIGSIPQFTIEMETGTGKTFVYLKTILRLWQEYGGQFKKFIIAVPSNPILLGVKKSIEQLADYFKPQFQNIDISEHYFVYDKNCSIDTVSSKFVESTDLSIMLITTHSFNKESNRLRKADERGIVVWDDIKDISPIIIIDEPQKLDGTTKKKSKSLLAIEELNPIMILRYSATHKNLYNQIYKLDSYQAYKKHLVKSIKVTTVHSLTTKDFPYIRFIDITKDLKARIEIFSNKQGNSTRFAKFDVENNASLEELSGGLPQYKNWYIAEQPNKLKPLVVSCGDNSPISLEKGKSNDEVSPEISLEMQMKLAIEVHINKQIEILESGKKIKALTLFFVDSVAKVRGNTEDGRGEYLVLFDKVFSEVRDRLMSRLDIQDAYRRFPNELAILGEDCPIAEIREGYFAVDKNSKAVEIEKWNSDVPDEDIKFDAKTQENIDRGIDLILNKKDELISFDEKLSFIFSHSALREGWDNPNVFTLVTLKKGSSEIAKKQEIGRGLRLPVDTDGCRCKNDDINELTVIANDYYDQFVSALHSDYDTSTGFNKDEVDADIVKNTMINAGLPKNKIEAACDAFKNEIIKSGIAKLDKSGKLKLSDKVENIDTYKFDDLTLAEHSVNILKEFKKLMTNKGRNKIPINNGDQPPIKNDFQKYVTEVEFDKMYRTMLKILQKKTIYRYNLDKEKFIQDVIARLNSLLMTKNNKVKFELTRANAGFNESKQIMMSNEQRIIAESENSINENKSRSLFELANYIMYNTMMPRLAILKILDGLNEKAREMINNQDYLEDAISLIKKTLVEYKSIDFLTAEIVDGIGAAEGEIFEIDKIINEENIKYLFTPKPSHRKALNLKYKLDSEGEVKFAESLDNDNNVLMYTKLKKNGFVIETPAGNYSPDWAIVYHSDEEKIKMYFIAETKYNKDNNDLSEDEKIKIRCAKKHFEAVNNEFVEKIKFAWVNGYKDNSKSNSFPEVFTVANYEDTLPIKRNI